MNGEAIFTRLDQSVGNITQVRFAAQVTMAMYPEKKWTTFIVQKTQE